VQIHPCGVLWVVQDAIEVDVGSLIEHTIEDTSAINLLLMYCRRDFCEREYQHPACGRDRVSQIFIARNLERHREFATHLSAGHQFFHSLGLTEGGLLLCRRLWGSSPLRTVLFGAVFFGTAFLDCLL